MLRKYIPNGFNLLVVLFVALGSTACSYGMAIIGCVGNHRPHKAIADSETSSTIGQPSFYTSLDLAPQGKPGYSRTAEFIGAFNGVNCAGSAIGAAVCSWSADKFGRKRTIQFASIILIIGTTICAGSFNNGMFMAGRIINGLGIGALVTVIPIYQAEVSTPESRGFMVSMHVSLRKSFHNHYEYEAILQGVMFAMGYTLSAWLGFGVYFISASGSPSSFPWYVSDN
jgi:MFS family permease